MRASVSTLGTSGMNIIRQINDLAENPPDGCESVDTLEEVEAPHKWSKDDIQQVQDKLTEICKDNSFSDIPDLWKQDTIDEINDAISQGLVRLQQLRLLQCQRDSRKHTVERLNRRTAPRTPQIVLEPVKPPHLLPVRQPFRRCTNGPTLGLPIVPHEPKEALDLANSYEQEAEAKAQESLDQANQCSPMSMVLSFTSLIRPTPWTDTENLISNSPCSERDPRSCQAWWQL